MPGPDEAMDLKPVGGSGGMHPLENFGICGYGDALWCNLMAKLYSAEINLNQRKISIKTSAKLYDHVNNWNKILLLIINKPC